MVAPLRFESSPTAQGELMALFGSKKGGKEYLAQKQKDELKKAIKNIRELQAALKKLLYQAEFHADEYRDDSSLSWEQRQLTPGVVARFEGMANDIRKALEIEKAS